MNISEIQEALSESGIDGWLFFDHHRRDPLAYRVLQLGEKTVVTRRWYYLIPAKGDPQKLVHRIESGALDDVHGSKRVYSSWTEQYEGLKQMLHSCRRVAMQFSPMCAIPYVSFVDAGTVDLVRSFEIEVVSSADLIAAFEARWSRENLECHLEAGRKVDEIRRNAFRFAGERLRSGVRVTEFDVKRFILDAFSRDRLITDHGPIVGVNANASNPHYEPEEGTSADIKKGDCLLIDLWAKRDHSAGVYYDITWVGFCGEPVPSSLENVFELVKRARDAGIKFVQEAIASGRHIRGYEVDRVTRGIITEAGFGDYFVHRTGHSIGQEVHGAGANMDDLETHDERRIIPWTCFSIEPGIYVPEFGIRLEVDVFVDEASARVTGEIQNEIVRV